MQILEILTIPNPILKTISKPVYKDNPGLQTLIENMIYTMNYHKACVGLAAIQVGFNLRLITVDSSRSSKPHESRGLMVLINPEIINCEGSILQREGCLSIPDWTGNVLRNHTITINAFDKDFKPAQFKTTGFEAVVLQHEIDHLNGILFLDKVASLKTDVFRRKQFVDNRVKKE
jgi:peptide deformylase